MPHSAFSQVTTCIDQHAHVFLPFAVTLSASLLPFFLSSVGLFPSVSVSVLSPLLSSSGAVSAPSTVRAFLCLS